MPKNLIVSLVWLVIIASKDPSAPYRQDKTSSRDKGTMAPHCEYSIKIKKLTLRSLSTTVKKGLTKVI